MHFSITVALPTSTSCERRGDYSSCSWGDDRYIKYLQRNKKGPPPPHLWGSWPIFATEFITKQLTFLALFYKSMVWKIQKNSKMAFKLWYEFKRDTKTASEKRENGSAQIRRRFQSTPIN